VKNRLDTTFVTHAKVARPSKNTTIGCAGASTRTITFRLSTGANSVADLQRFALFCPFTLTFYLTIVELLLVPPTHPSVVFEQQLDKKIAWNVRFYLTNAASGPGGPVSV
jgi:hypothetical protein